MRHPPVNPGAVQGSIEQFVAARQDAGRPVAAVSRLDRGKKGINASTGGSKVDKYSALPVPLTLAIIYVPLVILLDTRRSTNEVPLTDPCGTFVSIAMTRIRSYDILYCVGCGTLS